VINPHSFGSDGFDHVLEEIDGCFDGCIHSDYMVYVSRYSRDAVAAVHNYISSVSQEDKVRVYAIGGDGILFDCLNGMVDFPNAELTNVPYGKANDFVRGCFGDDGKKQFFDIKSLTTASSFPVDIMRCGANYAINETVFGMAGQTCLMANKLFRSKYSDFFRRFASMIYFICTVLTILNKEVMNQHYDVYVDKEDFSGCYFGIHISNSPCNGGTFIPNPYAQANDGIFNALFAKPDKKLTIFKSLSDLYSGNFEKHKFYIEKRCKKIEIKSDLPIRMEMDGEALYTGETTVEIIPGHIKFAIPEGVEFVDYSSIAYSQKHHRDLSNGN